MTRILVFVVLILTIAIIAQPSFADQAEEAVEPSQIERIKGMMLGNTLEDIIDDFSDREFIIAYVYTRAGDKRFQGSRDMGTLLMDGLQVGLQNRARIQINVCDLRGYDGEAPIPDDLKGYKGYDVANESVHRPDKTCWEDHINISVFGLPIKRPDGESGYICLRYTDEGKEGFGRRGEVWDYFYLAVYKGLKSLARRYAEDVGSSFSGPLGTKENGFVYDRGGHKVRSPSKETDFCGGVVRLVEKQIADHFRAIIQEEIEAREKESLKKMQEDSGQKQERENKRAAENKALLDSLK